jgi:hypothetical protein
MKFKIKLNFRRKLKAYSLLEMVVTLFLTSMIMLALVSLLAQILQISAITHNRTQTAEDVTNFVQLFEKDIRNAATVGECGGSGEDFSCEFFSNAVFRWQTCTPRELPAQCTDDNLGLCDTKNIDYTICKYRVDPDTNDVVGDPVYKLDGTYNIDRLVVENVAAPEGVAEDERTTRRVISLIINVSHPVNKFKIDNIVRQTLITTKNFEINLS